MVTPYDLPISFGAYVWACISTLVVTFVVLAVMPAAPAAQPRPEVTLWWVVPAAGRVAAVILLALTILAGLFGSPSPVANIAPALLWVGLMLCGAVVTALIGDVFQIIHPFAALLRWARVGDRPRRPYPDRMAAWPAFVCYMALAWLELMAPPDPSFLVGALLAYAAFTTAGAAVFGRETWFQRAELFGMFFRMTGKLASVAYRNDASGWHARRRPVLSGR